MQVEKKWLALGTIAVGIFMSTLDASIVNVANPTIARVMNVPINQVQWVVTAYISAITALLLLFGKLGDRLGADRLYSTGFLVFGSGSLLCSLAPSLALLIAFRVTQATGAAMMMATGNGIISNVFPPHERGRALGLLGTIVAIGSMTGPGLGGILVSALGWRSVFWVNIPISLAGCLMAGTFLPRQTPHPPVAGFDLKGLLLLMTGLLIFMLALSDGGLPRLWLFPALLLLCLFVANELRAADPLLDLRLFRIADFTLGSLASSASYMAYMGAIFLLPFYFERVMHLTPFQSGVFLTLVPLAMGITAPAAGYLSDRIGYRVLTTLGMGLLGGGCLVLAYSMKNLGIIQLIAGLVILGTGMGLFTSPNNSSIFGATPREQAGIVGSFLAVIRNLSMAVGITGAVSLFYGQPQMTAAGFAFGFSRVLTAAALVAAVGMVFTLIKGKRGSRQHGPQPRSSPES